MSIEIKKATIGDFKDIQNLNHQLFLKEFKDFDKTLDINWPFSREGKKYYSDKIKGKNNCTLIAFADKKVIGYMIGGIEKAESYRKMKTICELENTFVLPEYRGKGIGAKMIEKLLSWCKLKKVKRIKVLISSSNLQSIGFHKKHGFKDWAVVLEKDL